MCSPANSNELFSLELSWAWEPTYREGARGNHNGKRSHYSVCESAFFSGYSGPRIPGLNEKKGREDLVDRALAHRS